MQLLSKTSLLSTLLICSISHSSAQTIEKFRTPTKMYAGAYSIKIKLKKDLTEYDVPVWIKPDQAESVMDPTLLKELGYVDKEIIFQEVKVGEALVDKKKFKAQKTEWAFVPDFAKPCCYGVIGRDILENFNIRFDPKPPAHLEWTRVSNPAKNVSYSSAFLTELKKLFSLQQSLDVPVLLNLQEKVMKLEYTPEKSLPSLFGFFFVPPERTIQVTNVFSKDVPAAKKAAFTSGLVITHINDEPVNGIDRWVIEKYLRGEKGNTLKLTAKNKKEFNFDFKTRQFLIK